MNYQYSDIQTADTIDKHKASSTLNYQINSNDYRIADKDARTIGVLTALKAEQRRHNNIDTKKQKKQKNSSYKKSETQRRL